MKKILIILMIPLILYSQEFQITSNGSRRFAVDTFAKDIYWQELNTGIIYKTNIGTMETETTVFPSFPIFANKSHLAAYEFDQKLYLYDFNTNETNLLADSLQEFSIDFSFSPNDRTLVFSNQFYDLNDSTMYIPDTYFPTYMRVTWSSDTTLIFNSSESQFISEYNYITNTWDTVLALPDSLRVYSVDYSIKNKILAYSVEDVNAEPNNTLLKFFYIEEEKDSLIFDQWTGITEGACSHSYMAFTYLKWSRDEKRISFYSDPIINSGSGVLVHFLDSSFTKLYTRCDQYGVKVDTEWLGNDTIIYADLTRNQIYGFDIISPIMGIEDYYENIPSEFLFCNYPNPFNPSTTISYALPYSSNVEVTIYDITGKIVKIFGEQVQSCGYQNIVWNGDNQEGDRVSSGVYFYKLKATSLENGKRFEKTAKMLLLK